MKLFIILSLFFCGCASSIKTNHRLEQQKKELEKLGFLEVKYLK